MPGPSTRSALSSPLKTIPTTPTKRAAGIASTAQPAESPTKKRRTNNGPPEQAIASSSTINPATAQTASTTQPHHPLLPGTLSFDFQTAKSQIISHDARFERVFDKLKCKPFENLEAVDPFRSLCTSIVGQQVSWLAARAINHRFRLLFDPSLPPKAQDEEETLVPGQMTSFPTPEDVVARSVEELRGVGLSGRKVEYVKSLAEHFISNKLSSEFLSSAPVEEVSKALLDVRGIGQWTVDMFLIFTLRRPDILPVGDLGVQKGLLRWVLSAYANERHLPGTERVKSDSKEDPAEESVRGTPSTPPKDFSSILPAPEEEQEMKEEPPSTPKAKGKGKARETEPLQTGSVFFPSAPETPSGLLSSLDITQNPSSPSASPATPSKKPSTPSEKKKIKEEKDKRKALEDSLHLCPEGFVAEEIYPMPEGLTIGILKSRLAGKKAKGGAYLTPSEMDQLTERWKPYRSLGVYYMWAVAEETS